MSHTYPACSIALYFFATVGQMKEPRPSPSELALLKALWKQSPQSARELHNQIEPELQWSYSSTRKTLDRMRDKGFVSQSEVHGIHVFRAELEKVETLALYAKDFAERILELDATLTPDRACGAIPINGLLLAARRRGLTGRLLDLRNSGDTAGDRARVVGYGAFEFGAAP